jgi:putative transposase
MLPITAVTKCLQPTMTRATIAIFLSLVASFLCCRYEITTRGLSRYCDYSLRQIFRFLVGNHNWLLVRSSLFKSFFYQKDEVYILAVDEVVEGKSGHHTFGLSKYYSSISQKSIQGICFFALSLINIRTKQSFLLNSLQVVYSQEDKQRIAAKKEKTKLGKIRTKEGKNLPKGRKTKETKETKATKETKENLTASFRVFKDLFTTTMNALKNLLPAIKIAFLVADTAYGTLDYLKIAQAYGCKLISKMKANAALYEPAPKEKGKKGRPRLYGNKIDLTNIEAKYLKKTEQKDGKIHQYYQFFAYNKAIQGILLNIVVRITIDEKGKISTNVWFSNDSTISYEKLLEYYSMRFQIEFHFRNAKQHFGLADFKNYKEKNVTNFVNLSFTMCLMADIILQKYRTELQNPKLSVLDLKIIYNVQFTAQKVIKYLQVEDCNNYYANLIAKFVPTDIINRL